ncbi:hypothetical protein NL676_025972 [Syzygium grande]|nr:hypothetical protein NL676_025972 [Syzygium grande]
MEWRIRTKFKDSWENIHGKTRRAPRVRMRFGRSEDKIAGLGFAVLDNAQHLAWMDGECRGGGRAAVTTCHGRREATARSISARTSPGSVRPRILPQRHVSASRHPNPSIRHVAPPHPIIKLSVTRNSQSGKKAVETADHRRRPAEEKAGAGAGDAAVRPATDARPRAVAGRREKPPVTAPSDDPAVGPTSAGHVARPEHPRWGVPRVCFPGPLSRGWFSDSVPAAAPNYGNALRSIIGHRTNLGWIRTPGQAPFSRLSV